MNLHRTSSASRFTARHTWTDSNGVAHVALYLDSGDEYLAFTDVAECLALADAAQEAARMLRREQLRHINLTATAGAR